MHPSGVVSSATPHWTSPLQLKTALTQLGRAWSLYIRGICSLGAGFPSIVLHPSNSSGPGYLRGFRYQLTVLTVTSLCFTTFLNSEGALLGSLSPAAPLRHGGSRSRSMGSRRESGVAVESARECGLDVPPPGTKATGHRHRHRHAQAVESWEGRFASTCVSLKAYFCLSHDLPGTLPSIVQMHTIWQHNLEISGPSVQHEKIMEDEGNLNRCLAYFHPHHRASLKTASCRSIQHCLETFDLPHQPRSKPAPSSDLCLATISSRP